MRNVRLCLPYANNFYNKSIWMVFGGRFHLQNRVISFLVNGHEIYCCFCVCKNAMQQSKLTTFFIFSVA